MRALLQTAAGTLLVAGAASASQVYPAAVAQHLSLPYVPACSLCHLAGKTGPGTAETPFARSTRARGLRSGDTPLVAVALDALARDGVDSDGDGVTDINELVAGTDPNVAGGSSIELRADPGYGCSSADGSAGLAELVVALLFTRRGAAMSRRRLGVARPFR
jgi:hypothetical protein